MAESAPPRRPLPAGFLMGCASAAHQVEGGLDNDWTEMERNRPGAIADGTVSGIACDHFGRYREDLAAAAAMRNNAHRFSVEWSRVEPREGVIDRAALAHYVDVARECRHLGMEPMVTLLHFTLPRWLAQRGGLLAPDAPRCFARFAAVVGEALGPEVHWWVTINEPGVHAIMAHLLGFFPPNHTSMPETLRAGVALLRMHAAASRVLRQVARREGRMPMISVAHHERRIVPANPRSALDRLAAAGPDYLFNRWFLRSCRRGRILPPAGGGQVIEGLAGSLDYIGVNYYCEEAMRFDVRAPGMLFGERLPVADLEITGFGNTVDPGGLYRALISLWREFKLPMVITENGVADSEDATRPRFIIDHLNAALDAIDDGVDLRGYLHWSQMDNFEWAEGFSQHFGLYSVDRETMERRPRPSVAVFEDICSTRSVPASAGATDAG